MKNLLKKTSSFFLTLLMLLSLHVIGAGSIAANAYVKYTSRVSVHDPSIVKANGRYYLFGSHLSNAVSSDLASWQTFTTNINNNYASIFSQSGRWSAHGSNSYNISTNLWAPDVIYNPQMNKWCMYMSVNGDNYYSSML